MNERQRLNREAENFFYKSTVGALYHPVATMTRSRAGRASGVNAAPSQPVNVIFNLNPSPEDVTAFGDIANKPGQKAVIKVLAKDLTPEKTGAFTLGGVRYSVLALNPEYRAQEVFRWTVLAGFE